MTTTTNNNIHPIPSPKGGGREGANTQQHTTPPPLRGRQGGGPGGPRGWEGAFLFFILNLLFVISNWDVFTPVGVDYKRLFIDNFHVSGFDPLSYYILSDWHESYNVYRHPLFAYMLWSLSMLNQWLMGITGINCAIIIMAVLQTISASLTVLFMNRLLRDVIGMRRLHASLLTLMFMGFAYVMLSTLVPDHFGFSMMLLVFTLLKTGECLRDGRKMSVSLTIILFTLVAGISLNNGLKVFMASFATRMPMIVASLRSSKGWMERMRVFINRHIIGYIICAMVVPAGLMWTAAELTYQHFIYPDVHARQMKNAERNRERRRQKQERLIAAQKRDSMLLAWGDTAQWQMFRDSIAQYNKEVAERAAKKKAAKRVTQGTPIGDGEFSSWTDISTPRLPSIIHNLFGESLQLHTDYLLEDQLVSRPVIVHYRLWINYIVEGIIVLLFVIGIWCGRREWMMWTALSFFLMDMTLHIGLGFGINEVYIMTPHWAFAIPIAMAYALKKRNHTTTVILIVLTIWLWVWNVAAISTGTTQSPPAPEGGVLSPPSPPSGGM